MSFFSLFYCLSMGYNVNKPKGGFLLEWRGRPTNVFIAIDFVQQNNKLTHAAMTDSLTNSPNFRRLVK